MIKYLLSITLIVSLVTIGSLYALANPTVAQTPAQPTVGGSCDFGGLMQSLAQTESGRRYTARGPQTRYGVPLGKYQFIPPTQAAMLARYPQCSNGNNCNGDNILLPICHPTQDCIMERFMTENLARIRRDPTCQAHLASGGREIVGAARGRPTLSCRVTEAGLLAAMHLGGPGACSRLSNRNIDNVGTSTAYYACRHGNNPVPGNCDISSVPATATDPSLPSPVLTLVQLQEREAEDGPLAVMMADPILYTLVASLQLMAEQFTANMMAQVQSIGMFLDAKHQLETQRLFQQKTAEAHKDYHPSEQMCTFGTFARDLAATERSANLTRNTLSAEIMQRELGTGEAKAITPVSDKLSRIGTFRTKFCDPADNGNGLTLLCPSPPAADLRNRDINYTRTIDQPLSLKINMTDTTTTPDEEAVFALLDNLFAHHPLPRVPKTALEQRKYQYHYMNLRSIVAMRGIARNSFANIIALKTASPNTQDSSAPYIKALLRELGLQDEEIEKILGENPSYYAQMEVLTKKIYQNPQFYTNLYDKPVNVERIRTAMRAIKSMQDRDIHLSWQRREMLMSMMLELRLRKQADNVYDATQSVLFEAR